MFKPFLLTLLVLLGSGNALANDRTFGVGISLLDPTGFTGKMYIDAENAVDLAIAWDTTTTYVHSTYQYLISLHEEKDFHLSGHYGVGARFLMDREEGDEGREGTRYNGYSYKAEDENHLGLRAPVGVAAFFPDKNIEAFGEIGLVMDIIPETDFDSLLSIGLRLYF